MDSLLSDRYAVVTGHGTHGGAATLANESGEVGSWDTYALPATQGYLFRVHKREASPAQDWICSGHTLFASNLASRGYPTEQAIRLEDAMGYIPSTKVKCNFDIIVSPRVNVRDLTAPAVVGGLMVVFGNALRSDWPDESYRFAHPWAADPAGAEAAIEPSWLSEANRELDGLLILEPGWDSYGAKRIDPEAVESARQVIRAIARPDTPAPSIVPTSSGGVQIEWHTRGIDLEIELQPNDRIFIIFEDLGSGEKWEQEASRSQLRQVKEAVRRLSRPA